MGKDGGFAQTVAALPARALVRAGIAPQVQRERLQVLGPVGVEHDLLEIVQGLRTKLEQAELSGGASPLRKL